MIRILLVDDQVIIRQGLKALLELDPDLQVVGSADNGQTAIEQVEALQPDVVLIDIQMPGMDGVTATRIITQRFAGTKVLVLSGYDDDEYLADALRAGARGYLLKDTPAEELVASIRSIHRGYAQIGPGLFEKIPFGVPASNSVDSNQKHKMLALQNLRLGFKEGIRQGLSREALLMFYQEGALLEPEEAFSWLTQVDSPWNSESGMSFLLQEAEHMFGPDSTHCRTLLVLQQIRAMRAVSDSYASLEPMLQVLNQGFERLGKVIKG